MLRARARIAAGEEVEVMESKVVRRLAVSSSGWLGGGRCVQGKRGAKASEEGGRGGIESTEPKVSPEREGNLPARCARGTGCGATEANPPSRSRTRARSRKGRRSRKRNMLPGTDVTGAASWGEGSVCMRTGKTT